MQRSQFTDADQHPLYGRHSSGLALGKLRLPRPSTVEKTRTRADTFTCPVSVALPLSAGLAFLSVKKRVGSIEDEGEDEGDGGDGG